MTLAIEPMVNAGSYDVRIYLNSVKKIVSTINDAGIPAQIKQEVDGDDVIVTLRIKNTKKPNIAKNN